MELNTNDAESKCKTCGVVLCSSNYYFSYRPNIPVTRDEVFTKVCRFKKDGSPCENPLGKYDPKYDLFL